MWSTKKYISKCWTRYDCKYRHSLEIYLCMGDPFSSILKLKQNGYWLSQLVNTCDRSRSSVTSSLMIECFITIINCLKLIFKSRSRNPVPLFTLIEVLIITVCNFQSMKSPVELQTLQNLFLYHLVCYITWLNAILDDL